MTRKQFEQLKTNQSRISIHKIDWHDAVTHKHYTMWTCDEPKISFSDDHISLTGYTYMDNIDTRVPHSVTINRKQIIKIDYSSHD